ncbi:MAG: acetoacetate decarboxylase family protein [Proteobacteria bacterium]|nr:acetoacetate decarboxylase family protein [Pseudomonadota bacterium]
MGWVKTREELDRYYSFRVREFVGAQMLGVMFETRMDIVREVLPPPLEPAEQPAGLIFIASYPATNLGPGYREAALFLQCTYRGEPGTYCLSMPIDSEPVRMHNGRDIYGFPKKMADIHIERQGRHAVGWVERFGIRFVEIRAELTDSLPALPPMGPTFLFKALPAADLTPGFDGPVFLVRQQTEVRMKSLDIGGAEVLLQASEYDPWAEIELEKVLMAFYLVSDNTMQPGRVLAQVDPAGYLPYSFKSVDFFAG